MKAAPPPVPCRLSVILARSASVAVIFRRGPSKLVELMKWNTDTDSFERGQWLKGKIYDLCSDLSPNGSLLIYSAAKMQFRSRFDEDHFPVWTAISRPPWLTALALWPSPSGWDVGGGVFIDENTVSLSGYHTTPHKDHQPQGLHIVTEPGQHVATRRFTRDGWVQKEGARRYVWEKVNTGEGMTIVSEGCPLPDHSHGCEAYIHDFSVVDRSGGARITLAGATWADWDQQCRLVFVQSGKLFAGDFGAEGQMTPRELADFNADVFEPRPAPAWAREW